MDRLRKEGRMREVRKGTNLKWETGNENRNLPLSIVTKVGKVFVATGRSSLAGTGRDVGVVVIGEERDRKEEIGDLRERDLAGLLSPSQSLPSRSIVEGAGFGSNQLA